MKLENLHNQKVYKSVEIKTVWYFYKKKLEKGTR